MPALVISLVFNLALPSSEVQPPFLTGSSCRFNSRACYVDWLVSRVFFFDLSIFLIAPRAGSGDCDGPAGCMCGKKL